MSTATQLLSANIGQNEAPIGYHRGSKKMGKKLTATSYLLTDHGAVPLQDLSAEEWAEARKAMTRNVAKHMADYLRDNPEELAKIEKL